MLTKMEKRKEFGKWLQEQRQRAKLSQVEAAKQLGLDSKGLVVSYENGMAPIAIKRLFDVARVYRIPMNVLLTKLTECEPDLHETYIVLKDHFRADLLKEMGLIMEKYTSGRTDLVKAGEARHHSFPGLSPEFRKLFLYIMSTNA